jgi:hypothetical protein
MAPYWLVRLNDFLAWINPALGFVAAILALLVIATAAERLPVHARPALQGARPAVQSAQPNSAVASADCAGEVLPPEWRDLRLYD